LKADKWFVFHSLSRKKERKKEKEKKKADPFAPTKRSSTANSRNLIIMFSNGKMFVPNFVKIG
jgi:hypothetical protein